MWVTRVGQQFPNDLKLPKMKNCQSVFFLFSTSWKLFFNHSGTTIDSVERRILYYKSCKKIWVTRVSRQFPNELKLPKMKSLLYYKTSKNIWVTCANEVFYKQLDYVEPIDGTRAFFITNLSKTFEWLTKILGYTFWDCVIENFSWPTFEKTLTEPTDPNFWQPLKLVAAQGFYITKVSKTFEWLFHFIIYKSPEAKKIKRGLFYKNCLKPAV